MPRVGLRNSLRAFTLIELSIVLVVIGLIIGGVVAGKSLIKTAKSRATLSQIENYKTAFRIFQLQYDAPAGDLSNATSYWSTASNGDGQNSLFWPTTSESINAWHHLALAGLISGGYTGGTANATVVQTPNRDCPAAAGNPSANIVGWIISGYYGSGVGGSSARLSVVSNKTGCSNQYWCAGATLAEAAYWDAKSDDGIPSLGKIVTLLGWDTSAGQCMDSNGTYPGTAGAQYAYTTDNGGVNCWTQFIIRDPY